MDAVFKVVNKATYYSLNKYKVYKTDINTKTTMSSNVMHSNQVRSTSTRLPPTTDVADDSRSAGRRPAAVSFRYTSGTEGPFPVVGVPST